MKRSKSYPSAVACLLSIASSLYASVSVQTVNLNSPITASPILRDIDQDGDTEILIGSLIGQVTILDHTGTTLDGWPQATALFQRSSPNIGDIDGDGQLDVVVGDNDGKLHAWSLNGLSKEGFPIQLNGSIKSDIRLIDVDADGADEMLVHTGSSRLYLLDGSGTNLSGWPIDLGGKPDQFGSWLLASTPTVVDFDYDGSLEILIGTTANTLQAFRLDGTSLPGWPQATGDWIYPSVSSADLDGDYELETIIGSGDGKVYAWDRKGVLMPGFPITIGQAIVASVAVADLRGDAKPELVVADLSGNVYCYSSTGILLSGWPQAAASGIVGSPILVDVDADGALDVLAPSRDNTVRIWSSNGDAIDDIALTANDWIEATPAAGDLDQDGKLEIVYASYDGNVYIAQIDSPAPSPGQAWPSFQGESGSSTDRPAGDTDSDGLPDQLERDMLGTLVTTGFDDSDGDGLSNQDEWTAGTDLSDSQDFLRLTMTLDANTSSLRLDWTGQPNRHYQVMACTDIGDANASWIPIGDRISSNSATAIQCASILDLTEAQCFYRLSVERE